MAKGRPSSSSKKSEASETTFKQVNETERLYIMAQKVSVVLTHGDLINDIDCNFSDKTKGKCDVDCHNTENEDVTCSVRLRDQKHNGAVNLAGENVVDSKAESPLGGLSPVSFYGSKKQNLTPRIKLFSANVHNMLRDEHDSLISKHSPGVKRKYKKQSSSSVVQKKCRTSNVARRCKSSGIKNKLVSTTDENCSRSFKSDSLVDETTALDEVEQNKGGVHLCKSVTNGMNQNFGEGRFSPHEIHETEAVNVESCLPYEPEGNIIGSISDKSSPSLVRAVSSNQSEAESVCSETSLHSGPGSVTNGLFLRKNGNEYFFTNSMSSNSPTEQAESHVICKDITESITDGLVNSNPISAQNVENLFVKTPVFDAFTDDSQSSFSFSMPSPNTSESDFTLKLSEKDTDSSSAKSSPEHQAPITRYFKSTTGPKCKTKLINNGVPSPKTSWAENSPEVKNRESPPKRKKSGKKQEQMYLDLGQKDFGHVTCPTCGMVYTRAQPDDEAAHIRHHKSFVSGLRFTGWKNECVVKEFHDGRVIMVGPDDHPLHLKKVEEVRKVVDSELGFVADVPCRKSEAKTFLFITTKKVVGCAVAVQIDQGYPVLPSPGESSTPEKQIAAWCCSTTPQAAQCGISRIWVHRQHRRKKVATRLLDCVRMNFIYGCIIPRELVAFSDPTPDGKRLAKSYAGTSQFLVFR